MSDGLANQGAMNDGGERTRRGPAGMNPEAFAKMREAMMKREETAPKAGDAAPDFELPLLHGDGERVRLSALAGKPVVLLFGSYT